MKLDFEKMDGLIPAIVQDFRSGKVLMLGYMNQEALDKTQSEGKVTFYSRSKKALWTKGETSGNFLHVKELQKDCDSDTLLIKAVPDGPVCHTGKDTCFDESNSDSGILFLEKLEKIIENRKSAKPEESYTARLFGKGIARIAQKVGEEATEVVIDALSGDRYSLKEECADLIYHLLVLLRHNDVNLADVVEVLEKRHNK